MGENIKINEQSSADKLREQIRHTESDITETVQSIEQRLSPANLRRQGVRKAKAVAWRGAARVMELMQQRPLQLSLLGATTAATAAVVVLRRSSRRHKEEQVKHAAMESAGSAAKALSVSALGMLLRRVLAKRGLIEQKERPIGGVVLAATAAKAFLNGARNSRKSGTTRPGRKQAWRSLADAIGAALGTGWYGHRERRV
ncbi:DUF3618 domain-containing protein [Geoanaerobacter pelophilus]|uniref:DUF3618 domain-containing protein n=1 Tax=Geoanaerobacter pelophilus TaxID=60036 RepID=UPI000A26A717|nr:DUF3618 domain-containing protein [Geoanaerobacter pelophilus]